MLHDKSPILGFFRLPLLILGRRGLFPSSIERRALAGNLFKQQTLTRGFRIWLGALLLFCLLVNPLGITAPKRFWMPGDLNLVRPVAELATAAPPLQKIQIEQHLLSRPDPVPLLPAQSNLPGLGVTFPEWSAARLPDSFFFSASCAPRPPPVSIS